MANLFGRLKDYMLGGEDEYDDDAEYEEYEDVVDYKEEKKEMSIPAASSRATRSTAISKYDSKIVNIHTNVQMQVVISYPQTVDDAGPVCDYIKSNKTVVVNLENTKHEIAQRVVDFLGGVAYALDGDIQCVSNKIFIVAPKNVDISGHFKEELKANGLLFSFGQAFK